MSTFTVNPESLIELAGALAKIDATMGNMKNTADTYKGTLGGELVEGDLNDYCKAWK